MSEVANGMNNTTIMMKSSHNQQTKTKILLLLSIVVIALTSCPSCSSRNEKPSSYTNDTYNSTSYNSWDYPPSPPSTQPQPSDSVSQGSLNNIPTMSREEDAYEEGRALREEDHLNGTRMHEGDDYDDDYDEGYDE